jgi:hypothetical protein
MMFLIVILLCLDIGYWIFALAYHLNVRAMPAEAQSLVDSDGFDVLSIHVEDDVESLREKLFYDVAGAGGSVASVAMVRMGEDVAHCGHTEGRRDQVGARHGDQLSVDLDAIVDAILQLVGGEGIPAAQLVELAQVVQVGKVELHGWTRERPKVCRGYRHAKHVLDLVQGIIGLYHRQVLCPTGEVGPLRLQSRIQDSGYAIGIPHGEEGRRIEAGEKQG